MFIHAYDLYRNYSEAQMMCKEYGGVLADVLSETRTNFLASLVEKYSTNTTIGANDFNGDTSNFRIRHAFIGLTEIDRNGKFVSSQSKPIECFRYRAWSPRFPRFLFAFQNKSNDLIDYSLVSVRK